jgi:hypothetical protein
MILFRCPACGTAHRADPQYAGGTMPCRRCGKQVPIPRTSDPACALVYKAGEAEDGVPMTLDDIRLKLVSGELAETDLIWDNSTWKPLAQAFGNVSDGGGLHVKPHGEAKAEDPELDVPLRAMDAVQKVDMGTLRTGLFSGMRRKLFGLGRRRAGGAGKQPPAAAQMPAPANGSAVPPEAPQKAPSGRPEAQPRKPHGRAYYVGQCVLLALALTCGYKYGFGPLISSYRNIPARVIVQNHEDVDYAAAFGWRHAKADIASQGLAKFELWVGMPESQTLTIKPIVPEKAAPYSIRVPVRPGVTTLVNLRGKGEYGIYDLSAVADKQLDTPDVKALVAEIAANRAPASAVKVSRQIRDLVAPAFKGTKTDTILRGTLYDIDPALLSRLPPNQAIKEDATKKTESKPHPPRPIVTFPAARTVPFANGTALHCPADEEKVDRSLALPAITATLGEGAAARVLRVSSPRITMGGDAKVLNLSIVAPNATLETEGKTFTGQWTYSATWPREGKDAGTWRWNWAFTGTADAGGRRFAIDLKTEMGGRETCSIKPL